MEAPGKRSERSKSSAAKIKKKNQFDFKQTQTVSFGRCEVVEPHADCPAGTILQSPDVVLVPALACC